MVNDEVNLVYSSPKFSKGYIYKYINKDYPVAAKKVKERIIKTAESILPNPEKFVKEEYLAGEGNIRFRAVWSYKIVCLIQKDRVVILDIFDSRQNPEKMKDMRQ